VGTLGAVITLSNGEQVEFLTGSGALGFDGRGWWWEYPLRWAGLLNPHEFTIVVKTLTLRPRVGNLRWYAPWRCVRLIRGGTVNAVGLTNPGVDWWLRACYPRMQRMGLQTIVSVYPESVEEAQAFAQKLRGLQIAGIELNASCPNVAHCEAGTVQHVQAIAYALREAEHPLIVKVGYDQPYVAIAQAVEGIADAVHAINAVPWRLVFGERLSPLARLGGGGVSGEPIRPFVRAAVQQLRAHTRLPIIAGGGIYTLQDLDELWALGARAFSIGTLFLRAPLQPNRLVRAWKARQGTSAGQTPAIQ
jgi:dihydroorotate dehydrogenase (NAD+) catalytic subunit